MGKHNKLFVNQMCKQNKLFVNHKNILINMMLCKNVAYTRKKVVFARVTS